MKKLLLTALCAVAALAGSAAEFTYSIKLTKKADLPNTETTIQGVKWTYTSEPVNYDKARGVQLFAKKVEENSTNAWTISTTTFDAATISKVVLYTSTTKDGKLDLSVKVGETAFTSETSQCTATTATPFTFTGSASGNLSITIEKAKNGESLIASGAYLDSIAVTYTADAEIKGEETPDTPVETVGKGTEAEPYTVADLIALKNPGTEAWVKGVIVGCMNYDETAKKNVFSATELKTNSNIVIAAAATGYDNNISAIQLPAGDIRTALNVVDNAGNIGKEVVVYGTLESYCSTSGVKNTSKYTLDGKQGSVEEPAAPETGAGSKTEPLTVTDAIAKNNDGKIYWVEGVIVGCMNYDETAKQNVFSATELTTNTNIVIAATAADYGTTYMAVQLPAGDIRNDLNLVDRPALIGRTVSVCGTLSKYCGVNGVYGTTEYTIVGGLPEKPVATTATLTTFVEDQCKTNTKITGNVTVFYQSPDKKYTFITDGTTNLEVYGTLENAYTNGDVLSGIIGKFDTYQNMPQMVPDTESFGTATAGTAIVPTTVTDYSKVTPNDYVNIEDATIVATTEGDKTTYTITDGTTELVVFNRFNIELAAAEHVTILGIGAIYGETKQIFPITVGTTSGISEIAAEKASANGIYDLQGRKLTAPIKGINIINGKKVLVK